MSGHGELLHERALRAANRGAFARAVSLLDRAVVAGLEPDLAARVELTRAYLDAETGEAATALERCQAILARQDLEATTHGLAWSQLGLLHMRRGEGDAAVQAFAQALALLPATGAATALVFLNRGNVHLQADALDAASSDFALARDGFDAIGDAVQRAKAEHNLGYTRLLAGDLVGALQLIERAAVVLADLSPAYRATVEQDRAEVLTAAGRPREAARALREAAAAYGQRRLRTFQADCELTLAWTLLREDPASARLVARRAARRFRSQSSPARALRADAAAVIAEIATGTRTRSLLEQADTLAAELRAGGDRRDAELVVLQSVRLAVARNDLDGAALRLRQVRIGPDAPVATRLLEREVRADLARARGDARRAHDHVRSGLADLHGWQSSFGSLDLQSTLVGHGRTLARQGMRIAVEDGRPELLLEWSERARALVSRVTPVRPPADEQLAADLAVLRSLPPQDRAAERAQELRERIRHRSWHAEGGGEVGEPASLPALQEALATDDAALVAHVAVEDSLTALVVTGDGAAVVPLGPLAGLRGRLDTLTADLTTAAEHRSGPLAEAVRGSLRARLDAVAAQVVAPLRDAVGDRRVVLTPAGALAGTPWTLLPGLAGRPLTVAPSATRWLELRAMSPSIRRVGLVAGPGLARAEEEVDRAAARWRDATVLTRAAASAEAVSALASEVDLLHLAGHGSHPGENPLFAAVRLADGPWYGYDIDRLASVPSTVVLSACELGRASVRSGEESVGMTAAWLHAGARTVLSAPVIIADDVACEALARWHALVAAGTPPADALAGLTEEVGDVVPLVCAGAGW